MVIARAAASSLMLIIETAANRSPASLISTVIIAMRNLWRHSRTATITDEVARHMAALATLTAMALFILAPLCSNSHAAIVTFAPIQVSHVQSECCVESPCWTMVMTVGR